MQELWSLRLIKLYLNSVYYATHVLQSAQTGPRGLLIYFFQLSLKSDILDFNLKNNEGNVEREAIWNYLNIAIRVLSNQTMLPRI